MIRTARRPSPSAYAPRSIRGTVDGQKPCPIQTQHHAVSREGAFAAWKDDVLRVQLTIHGGQFQRFLLPTIIISNQSKIALCRRVVHFLRPFYLCFCSGFDRSHLQPFLRGWDVLYEHGVLGAPFVVTRRAARLATAPLNALHPPPWRCIAYIDYEIRGFAGVLPLIITRAGGSGQRQASRGSR